MQLFLEGIFAYKDAFSLASRHRLWRFLLIPFAASLLSFVLLFYWASELSSKLMSFLLTLFSIELSGTFLGIGYGLVSFVFFVSFMIMGFKYMVLIISFPFMSFVSQRVASILNEREDANAPTFKVSQFFYEMYRGILITLRIIWVEVLLLFPLFLFSLIPGLVLLTGPVIFLVQSFFAGACNMDYTLERYFNVSDAWDFMKSKSSYAIGNGIVYYGILSIPVLGLFVAPLIATIAATIGILPYLQSRSVKH